MQHSPSPPSPRFNISIEGNVGAGKSTFLSHFRRMIPSAYIIQQPLPLWQNISGDNLLSLYYHNRKRWAFTFQTLAIVSRIPLWRTAHQSSAQFIVSQRSMLADWSVFGKLMIEQENMIAVEADTYNLLAKEFIGQFPLQGMIYLDCSPEECLERMKRRDRLNQKETPVEFMRSLERKHVEMLRDNGEIKVLVVSTEEYDLGREEDFGKVKGMVERFFEELAGGKIEVRSEELLKIFERVLVTKPVQEVQIPKPIQLLQPTEQIKTTPTFPPKQPNQQ